VRRARDGLALGQRLKKVLLGVGAKIRGSVDQQYEAMSVKCLCESPNPVVFRAGSGSSPVPVIERVFSILVYM
jgi:hypothetical protein